MLGGLFGHLLLKSAPPQLIIGIEDEDDFKRNHDATSRHIYSHKDILVKLGQDTLSEDDISRLRKQINKELQNENLRPQVKVELAKCLHMLNLVAGNLLGRLDQLQQLQDTVSPSLLTA